MWARDAGCGPALLFELADVGLLVSQPEPNCIERDYRFLRHLCRWRLAAWEVAQKIPASGWLPVPWLSSVQRVDSELARAIQEHLRRAPLLLLVNQARAPEERNLGVEMMAVFRRFFGIRGEAVGWLEYDERVWLSIRERQPVALAYPSSSWVEQFQHVTQAILDVLEEMSS